MVENGANLERNKPTNQESLKAKKDKAWWQPAMVMFIKLAGWIAIPVIIALYLGQWLDRKYKSEPWLFLFCVGLAFTISMIGLVKNTISEFKKIEENSKEKNKQE